MKTMKLFLMAAMLLTSMCAFAQSGNKEPLKGDVNGDGKVDVADITAIVKIIMENGSGTDSYYTWYQGLASENQIQNQSYINGLSYNKTTKPTSTVGLSKGYNVFIFPSSWGTPTLYEDEAHTFRWSPYTSQELGITNPSGKNVLVWEAPNPATMFIVWPETYYWYVGTELPTTSSNPSSNITTSNTTANAWHEIGTTLGSYSATNPLVNGSRNPININPEYDDVLYYICIPVGLGIYDGFGTNVAGSNTFPLVSGNITIAGKQYNIYSNVNSDFLGKVY